MGWEIAVKDFFIDLIKIFMTKKNLSDMIIDAINVRLLSQDLVKANDLSVDCFFIVMVHNGGGKVSPDNFIYWSIIDGYYKELMMKKFDHKHYKLVNTSLEFLQLARQIYEKKEVAVRVSEMTKSSLRTSFEYEGLKYMRFFYIKQDKKRAMWFIMVGTTAENEPLADVDHEGKILIAVNHVKNIIMGY